MTKLVMEIQQTDMNYWERRSGRVGEQPWILVPQPKVKRVPPGLIHTRPD